MKIQIIPSKDQQILSEYYGCRLGNVYKVIGIKELKDHTEYKIEAFVNYPSNSFGERTVIKINDSECRIISLK